MTWTRRIFDVASLALLATAGALVWLRPASRLLPEELPLHAAFILSLEGSILSALASFSGMLIAAFLISSHLGDGRPYSRIATSFRSTSGWYPFAYLFLTAVLSSSLMAAAYRVRHPWTAIVDASAIMFFGSITALISLVIYSFAILSPKSAVDRLLQRYTARSVQKYGLLDVTSGRRGSIASYRLRTWGHRHNLFDPLGGFHDMLMDAVGDRERITVHLLLDRLMDRVANLNGVSLHRGFALASVDQRSRTGTFLRNLVDFTRSPLRPRRAVALQITAHALHYMVRRSNRLMTEWTLDNHRQIFTINIANLLRTLIKTKRPELLDICIDAIIRINHDYRAITSHGSYEPVHELFKLAQELDRNGLFEPSARLVRGLAFLDENTTYVRRSTLSDWAQTSDDLPADLDSRFRAAKRSIAGRTAAALFPGSLW